MGRADVAFYCVADSDYFLGLVALLNSLRLLGHDEQLFVLDRGLTTDQRSRLDEHVVLLSEPDGAHPTLSKYFGPLRYPAKVMVLVDTDIIFSRRLDPLIAVARNGKIVAFADVIDRFFPQWQTILDLPPLRRQTYVNSGIFIFSQETGIDLLAKVKRSQRKVELERSRFGRGTRGDPFFYPDQDSWNAVLASLVPQERLLILENRMAPFPRFRGLSLEDPRRLLCRYPDGERPYALHAIGWKPWLAPTPRSLYTLLMTRLLLADDLPLRVERREVPWRLREGLLAEAAAHLAGQRGKLGIRPRIAVALETLRKGRYPSAP